MSISQQPFPFFLNPELNFQASAQALDDYLTLVCLCHFNFPYQLYALLQDPKTPIKLMKMDQHLKISEPLAGNLMQDLKLSKR